MPAGIAVWDKATRGRKKLRQGWFVGSTGDVGRGKRRLQLKFCCRPRKETGDWVWGGQRDKDFLWYSEKAFISGFKSVFLIISWESSYRFFFFFGQS